MKSPHKNTLQALVGWIKPNVFSFVFAWGNRAASLLFVQCIPCQSIFIYIFGTSKLRIMFPLSHSIDPGPGK